MLQRSSNLRHIWIEITNRCNLTCVHCYANSGPHVDTSGEIPDDRVLNLLAEAQAEGCTSVQFIGGEPMIHPSLPQFIRRAYDLGYDDIEVYSNLVSLPAAALLSIETFKARVATSFYSAQATVHDAVTSQSGSWKKTLKNIERLQAAGVPIRIGFIETEQNAGEYEGVCSLFAELGISEVGYDAARPFGRAAETDELRPEGLCGNCTAGNLCVMPNGDVSLCIMSRASVVANVRDVSLRQLFAGGSVASAREALEDAWDLLPAWEGHRHDTTQECDPACRPNCEPSCNPRCSPNCSPCFPAGKCNPELFRG